MGAGPFVPGLQDSICALVARRQIYARSFAVMAAILFDSS